MYLFFQSREYSARTAPVEHRADYPCDHCGRVLHALAYAEGHGSSTALYDFGGASAHHQQAARGAALASATAHGERAMAMALCPHCGRASKRGEQELETAARREAWRRRLICTVPPLAAVTVLLLFARPALAELRDSTSLLRCGIGVAAAVAFALLAILLALRGGVVNRPNAGVYFWLSPSPPPEQYRKNAAESFEWVAAAVRSQPHAFRWAGTAAPFAVGLTLVGGGYALIGFLDYEMAVVPLTIVTRAPAGTLVTVAQPGESGSSAFVPATSTRLFAHHIGVSRRGPQEVRVTLGGPSPFERTYLLPRSPHGWVIAPRAASFDICLADDRASLSAAETDGDVFVLPRAMRLEVEGPPPAEAHGLRVVSCNPPSR